MLAGGEGGVAGNSWFEFRPMDFGFTEMSEQTPVEFSRAAYDAFLRLDPQARRLVTLAAVSEGTREIAPGIFSTDAGPSLRVVFRRGGSLTSVLALTGGSAA
jgi:hypothetical protein